MEKNNEPVLDDDGREEWTLVQENDDVFGFTLDCYYFGRREFVFLFLRMLIKTLWGLL